MFRSIVSAVALGATTASATPFGPMNMFGWGGSSTPAGGNNGPVPSSTASAPLGPQTPFVFPLANGFPNFDNASLLQLEQTGHGTLPNTGLPSSINASSVPVLQLIAFNEFFEVAWFASLLANITNNVPGYTVDSPILRDSLIRTFTAVQAQESLHYLGANGILNASGNANATIPPCEYVFPDWTLEQALSSSATHTDDVLGALPDAEAAFVANGDSELVPLISSVIGQEGEQDGYYRSLLNLIPSANPFLTRSAGAFLFSEINQLYVVPGSCTGPANQALFASIPVFGKLNLVSQITQLVDTTLTFPVQSNASTSDWSIVYINQQNAPVVESISNVQSSAQDDTIMFDAYFPGADLIMDGLTIVAVTNGTGPFAGADQVAAATLFGPYLLEMN